MAIRWTRTGAEGSGYIPPDATVRFTHQENGDEIMVDVQDGKLVVRSMSETITIQPRVGNWIVVWTESP